VRLDGKLPFRGEVVWLTSEQGGRSSGPPPTPVGEDYAATAYVPPASSSDGLASIVLRVVDRNAWRSAATAGWLVAGNDGLQHVETGSVVVVTEGSRPVAYFHVVEVAAFA
jgi:hypothetical protein